MEVTRHNFLSLPHQTWRDGPTSNFDELGHMPNVAEPIAYLDIQALSADALDAMAALVREGLPSTELPIGEQPSNDIAWSQVLEENARAIRSATQRKFWLADAGYYAFALDRDAQGRRRVLRAAQSNAGWLLATRFFDDLPPDEREQGISGVVRTLFSPAFLTPAGIRGRSLEQHNPRFLNYHEPVWPVDTFMTAKGLRRLGFDSLADELESRLVNTSNLLGGALGVRRRRLPGPHRRPTQAARRTRTRTCAPLALPSEMPPEADQAWTATALLRIKRDRYLRRHGAGGARTSAGNRARRTAQQRRRRTLGPGSHGGGASGDPALVRLSLARGAGGGPHGPLTAPHRPAQRPAPGRR